ncbi:MAG: type II toxin-antitoxin system HicA family toxin [Symbiobacteriia bacterium]
MSPQPQPQPGRRRRGTLPLRPGGDSRAGCTDEFLAAERLKSRGPRTLQLHRENLEAARRDLAGGGPDPAPARSGFDNTTYRLYIGLMNGKELVKVLERNGWTVRRIRGSHHIMVKLGCPTIPVPVHGAKDLPAGLIKAIMKEAGIE